MYNNYIKLTEKHTRDKTRTVYINLDLVHMVAAIDGGTRLFVNDKMIDVTETPEHILSIPQIVLTDKENVKDTSDEGVISN